MFNLLAEQTNQSNFQELANYIYMGSKDSRYLAWLPIDFLHLGGEKICGTLPFSKNYPVLNPKNNGVFSHNSRIKTYLMFCQKPFKIILVVFSLDKSVC